MYNVDIEIYLNQLKTFFKNNPQDLFNLIGYGDEKKFYDEIEKQINKNYTNGDDIELTQKQIVEITVKMNLQKIKKDVSLIFQTKYGSFSLN
jgi:hypothetical protein